MAITRIIECDLCGKRIEPRDRYFDITVEEYNLGRWQARWDPLQSCEDCWKSQQKRE